MMISLPRSGTDPALGQKAAEITQNLHGSQARYAPKQGHDFGRFRKEHGLVGLLEFHPGEPHGYFGSFYPHGKTGKPKHRWNRDREGLRQAGLDLKHIECFRIEPEAAFLAAALGVETVPPPFDVDPLGGRLHEVERDGARRAVRGGSRRPELDTRLVFRQEKPERLRGASLRVGALRPLLFPGGLSVHKLKRALDAKLTVAFRLRIARHAQFVYRDAGLANGRAIEFH